MKVGIESLSMYVPAYYLDLADLAKAREVSATKFPQGLGQERMAVPAPDEDVVTMGANAAAQALDTIDPSAIDTVIFATESGVDQSKAASIYVHGLLGLPPRCRTFEVKQACCSSTAALQMALSSAALKPDRKTLIIASDIARYGIGTPGEPTQGAGAIAMVVSAEPRLVCIDIEQGCYTEDVMDFWRPNYLDEALVDGKYSIKVYLHALEESWKDYREQTGARFEDFQRFCYHLPFTRMAEKAHQHLARLDGSSLSREARAAQIEESLCYNRVIGNCYTASLYIGLLSLLEQSSENLGGLRTGLFSYGSGCMGSFFGGTVSAGYREHLQKDLHTELLERRERLDLETYHDFYNHHLPEDGGRYETAVHRTGRFRLAGVEDHRRVYRRVEKQSALPGASAQERRAPISV